VTGQHRRSVAELHRLENVVLQQMEHDDMTNEDHRNNRATPERDQIKGSRSPARPTPPSNSPISNDGPELPRSIHC
jgi:hypothetical protein